MNLETILAALSLPRRTGLDFRAPPYCSKEATD